MYFTRCPINAARRGARSLLASPHRMHAAVLSGFGPGEAADTGRGRVLWRVDRREHVTELFIVSPGRPDLTHVVEQAGWPTTHTWQTTEYGPFLGKLDVGQRWAFRLAANPVHSVSTGIGNRGKPMAHVTAQQQLRWLLQRAERMGARLIDEDEVPTVEIVRRDVQTFTKGETSGSRHRVTLATAVFDGVLSVVDAGRLRSVLVEGLGRARGYGCGLVTLAPPR